MNNIKEDLQIVLRKTKPDDLEALFFHQLDEDYAHTAAFVNENYQNKEAYLEKWNKLLTDETINIRTIILGGKVVGSVSTWQLHGDLQISYGVSKAYWNRGIVTRAVQQFLAIVPTRPLYGRVAFDNIGSMKVLEKCGFKRVGEDRFYAHARKEEIQEIIFLLED